MTDTAGDQDATSSPVLAGLPGQPKTWRAGNLVYSSRGLAAVFFWILFGDFAYQLKERAAQPTLQVLLRQYHASDLILSIIIGSLPQIVYIFIGPAIGYRSDRHRGPWGRRIPYLLAMTPITVLSMIGLAFSPAVGRWFVSVTHNALSLDHAVIALFTLFWTLFEVCTVVCSALLLGLGNDVIPHSLLGRFFGLFRLFSVGAGIFYFLYLMGKVENHYLVILLGLAAVYGISFTAMCLGVREPQYPPPDSNPHGALAATRTYLRECFSHPYYVWYFASVTAAYVAVQPINIFSIPFAHALNVSDATYGFYSACQLFLSLLISYPIGFLCDKFHPLRMMIVSLILHGLIVLASFAFVHGSASFGVAHIIGGAMAGFWITVWYALTPALVPRAKFAQYFTAMTICYAIAQFVSGLMYGQLFDMMHHQYRVMYLLACFFDCFALLFTIVVYRYFLKYGGMRHYIPPEAISVDRAGFPI